MTTWEFHEQYDTLDVEKIRGYPNHLSLEWLEHLPKFGSDAINHVVTFLRYTSKINVIHDDALIKLFVYSLERDQNDCFQIYEYIL